MTTLTRLRQTLDTVQEAYHVMPLQSGMSALITQRGARVLGIFPSDEGENLLWTHPALNDAADFADFIARREWNMGGERCWIAPEIQYNVLDRTDFWGTLTVPAAMDPGRYNLKIRPHGVQLDQSFTLVAHGLAEGKKTLELERTLRPIENPLQRHHEAETLMQGVQYGGYEQRVTLRDMNDTDILSETWNLVQLNAGGTLIIPCTPTIDASDYFGSPVDECRLVERGAIRIPITGKQQFKVGYKALCMTGRMGYHIPLADGQHALLVRLFPNQPANVYAEEPPDQPGVNGHSVHVYNDGENGFGEMECTGTTIGKPIRRNMARDLFSMSVYVGTKAGIGRIAHVLLGVKL